VSAPASARISQSLIDEIVDHARDDLPNECCGIIGGRGEEMTSVYRARNSEETWLRYNIHPEDLFRITERLIPEAGEEVVGFYHSHTKSPAEPSQTDINLAENWPGALQLICSLQHDDAPVVRAYLLDDRRVQEVDLDVG
jgi:proteasome lid subunit RPN8/RPN11